MKKRALVIGGTSGIGFSIGKELFLRNYNKVFLLGRNYPVEEIQYNMEYIKFDLLKDDYNKINDIIEKYDIDTIIISAGFGRVSFFSDIDDDEIVNMFTVNSIAPIRIIKMFYDKLESKKDINCVVISSISGFVSSPLFSVYSATKASLTKFIEAINIELEKNGTKNRILNVSPGYIKGTGFDNKENNNSLLTKKLASDIVDNMEKKEVLYIPEYEEVYKSVIDRYKENPYKFGIESYDYKLKSGRVNKK